MDYDTSKEPTPPSASSCSNCRNMKSYFNTKFHMVAENMKNHQTLLLKALENERASHTKQMATVLEALTEQKAIVKKIQLQLARGGSDQILENVDDPLEMKLMPQTSDFRDTDSLDDPLEKIATPQTSDFPIHTEKELADIDAKIQPENRDSFITTLQNILWNNANKNISKILSESIVLDYNIDGTHGKSRLKDYENLYYVLLKSLPDTEDPEGCLRKAIQSVKKRYFNRVCTQSKMSMAGRTSLAKKSFKFT